jgi:hypothetical protein
MRLITKTSIIAATLLLLVVTSAVLPATAGATTPSAKMTTLAGVTTCPKNTAVKVAEIDKYFLDPREHPANGGYSGSNIANIQVFGLITKTMGTTTFPTPLTATTVTITIAAVLPGTYALVDDFLPNGFTFTNPTAPGAFLDNGLPANVVLLFDGMVRIRCSTPGTHTITFSVTSPKWGVSYFSQDFARVFYINTSGFVWGFDWTAVTVFVQGTGSFIMGAACTVKPNYRPQVTQVCQYAK